MQTISTIYLFLSHSWRDKDFVRKLDQSLQLHGIPTFLDERDIKIGDSIPTKISEAIERSSHVAYVISKHSVQSRWVTEELDAARVRHKEREGFKILPLRIDDVEIPMGVRHLRWADFRNWEFPESYFCSLRDLLSAIGYEWTISSTTETRLFLDLHVELERAFQATLLAYRMSDLAMDIGLELSRAHSWSIEAAMRMCWHRLRDVEYLISMKAVLERLDRFREHESDRLRQLRELCSNAVSLYISEEPRGADFVSNKEIQRGGYANFEDVNYQASRILFAILSENRNVISAGLAINQRN